MSGAALDRVFREASGRIIGALAFRFRDLALAEDSFAEACRRGLEIWPRQPLPQDPAAWLYQVALRYGIDNLRRRRTTQRFGADCPEPVVSDIADDYDAGLIPDERLRLVFVCCHPAINPEARAALTLRLVCGLSTREIARAFLVSEVTLQQRIVRAKRKIAEAAISFEVPGPSQWPERLDAVLSTLEIAYSKAYEDARGRGPHAGYAAEVLELSAILVSLLPGEADVWALGAIVRFTEGRRPARIDAGGQMIPLAEQDPQRWNQTLIEDARMCLARAVALDPTRPRVIQAHIHEAWCRRHTLSEPAPWSRILSLYDAMLQVRDDAIIRLNRAVALAEVAGLAPALAEVDALDATVLADFQAYHSVRADLLRRLGRQAEAARAYEAAIALTSTPAELEWLTRRREALEH